MMLDILSDQDAVATWSGGLDTTTLIPYAIKRLRVTVHPIFVNRSQENYTKEKEAIEFFSQLFRGKYRTKFKEPFEVTMPIPPPEFMEIKEVTSKDLEETIFLLRNSDIVNQAVRYASLHDIDYILVGSNVGDTFRDNSLRYWKSKTEEVKEGSGNSDLRVVAPFQELGWNKKDMVIWSHRNEIPVHRSWSCWRAYERHCGVCPPCKRRKEAFEQAQIEDKTGYLE